MFFLLAVILGTAATPPIIPGAKAEPSPQSVRFPVGGVELSMPLPTGYCLPSGRIAVAAQLIAAADNENVTHASFFECSALEAPSQSYWLIKTLKPLLASPMTREAFLAAVAKEFALPGNDSDLNRSADSAAQDLGKVLNRKVDLTSAVAARGTDDVCAYLAGKVHVKSEKTEYDIALGACLTVAGGRQITVYRYGPDVSAAGVAKLVREARAVALTIAPATRP